MGKCLIVLVSLVLIATTWVFWIEAPVSAQAPTPTRSAWQATSLAESSAHIVDIQADDSPRNPRSPRAPCTEPPPTLSSPLDGIVVDTLIPNLVITTTTATKYRIQISTFSDFQSMYYETTWVYATGPSLSMSLSMNLLPNTVYYWRVASVCADFTAGAYSASRSFSTANLTGPFLGPPALVSPTDGQVIPSLRATFRWGSVSGATAWQIRWYHTLTDAQSDTNYILGPIAAGQYASVWSTMTSKTFPTAKTYYWRVMAGDATAWGPLSSVRAFTTSYGLFLPLVQK